MDELPEVLTRLNTRIDALEDRVALLEHPSELAATLPAPSPLELPSASALQSSSLTQSGATFAVIGKAMLGMAGAYLLRAIAESGSFPKLAVVVIAIAYAGMWLAWAVRVPAGAWFASTTYACTSALIFAPMLWELTLRFNVLPPPITACVLGAFVLAVYALAWKRNLTSVVWVGAVTAATTAIALLVATHATGSFIAALLLLAFVTELAAVRNRWLSIRPVVAIAADLAVWSLIFIYSSAAADRTDYPGLGTLALVAPACILVLIYGISIALRTVLHRRTIALYEAGQAIVAFLLAASALLHFGPANSPILLGAFCLLLAPACYAVAFLRFDCVSESRNYAVYAMWSAALLLAGCFLCLPQLWLASCLGIAAILTTLVGVQRSRLTLEFHGLLYLIAAAFASGFLQYAAHALAGAFPHPPVGIAWVVAASAVLCYAIGGQLQRGNWKLRLFHTLSATLALGAVATLLISALVGLAASIITPGEQHVAVIRTLAACALTLSLAFVGPRWNRAELVWISYAGLVLVAAKLLLEDLRQGHPEFIAISIFLFAVTLILVPRIARKSSRKRQPTADSELIADR